ncbi:MAG: hypothetical protein HY046_07920 [Acidobacteria bacterium]|nr:hypothetical protein [Acidobacteriota bacterium]
MNFMWAILQLRIPGSQSEWSVILRSGFVFIGAFILALLVLSYVIRKTLRRDPKKEPVDEFAPPPVRTDNESAFLSASMQGVIKRLRDQEKELERLRRIEQERAQQSERLSDAVTRNMPTGLLLVNVTGLITNANPAALAALGIGSVTYRRYAEVFGPDSPMTRLLTQCLREARTFQREEVQHTVPEGSIRQLGATISPIFQPPAPGQKQEEVPARVTGALCLLSDLTELTALQREIRLKENLASLGEMSAGIAHEFKNALATISGYAQMIRGEASGDAAENAERILGESRQLTHVVTEFLRFARPIELSKEVVEVRPLLERVAEDVTGAVPSVEVHMEGEFSLVSGDDGLLRQALLNLMRNAAEAAAANSTQSRRPQVMVTGSMESNHALATRELVQRISIADNGPGIPAEDLPKVFLPFFTTKSNGTGLGLAVVQKIVLQHGGSIEARNRPDGGAEFILWLPASPGTIQAVDSPSARI